MRLGGNRKVSLTTFIKVQEEATVLNLMFKKKTGWIEEIMGNLGEGGMVEVKIIDRRGLILTRSQEVAAARTMTDLKLEIVEGTDVMKTDNSTREIEGMTDRQMKIDHSTREIEGMTDHQMKIDHSTREIEGMTDHQMKIDHSTREIEERIDHHIKATEEEILSTLAVVGVTTMVIHTVKLPTVEVTEEAEAQILQQPEVAIGKISSERLSIQIRITQQKIPLSKRLMKMAATVTMKQVMLPGEVEAVTEVVTVVEVCKIGEAVPITRKTRLTKSMLQIFDVTGYY
jgi:hypothetical protein